MQRDVLLLEEMIEAAEQIRVLTGHLQAVADLEADRLRRDALLWNFTVLGEAASQLSDRVRNGYPEVAWHRPALAVRLGALWRRPNQTRAQPS